MIANFGVVNSALQSFTTNGFPFASFRPGSEGQPMVCASDDAADGERAFRLAFPKKRAVQFRFANKRTEADRQHR